MDSAFTFIEQILQRQKNDDPDFPYQEILLMRLSLYTHAKLFEFRNRMFKRHNLNETLFMALVILKSQKNQSIQPSELSKALNSSKTNATRVADELEQRGWIERQVNSCDRRSQLLALTPAGRQFLEQILPAQHTQLRQLWSTLSNNEQRQLEATMYKLIERLEQIDAPESSLS